MSESGTRVRLIDVAERAKVSRGAVARVLLGTGAGRVRVSEEKAALIKRLAEEMGFAPDNSAQMLKGKKSKIIGVLIDSYAPQSQFHILGAIEEVLRQKGYRILVGQTHDNYENLKLYISDFTSRRVDGIICLAHGYREFDTINDFKNFQHVVFVGEPRGENVSYVAIDTKSGVRKIVRHLLGTGRKRIGHFLLNSGSIAHMRRLDGYREELESNSIVFDEKLIFNASRPIDESDYMEVIDKLVVQQKVDAIIANNDMWGVMLIKYLQMRGIDVPGQVAVAGWDNQDIVNVSTPKLTSVDIDSNAQGKAIADMLIDKIEKNEHTHKQIIIEPELIIRKSTK